MNAQTFEQRVSTTCENIRNGMRRLAKRLESGDQSELIYWIRPKEFGCTVRPLRRHPLYAGGRRPLPPQARPLVDEWVTLVKVEEVQSILSLMHDEDLACYGSLGLTNNSLLDHLVEAGFDVGRCPYEDPYYKSSSEQEKRKTLIEVRKKALDAFNLLPRPVVIMCSSGIDRSSPVAAFIVESLWST